MSEEKKSKKKIDEAMVDKIVEETKQQKNLKEQIYDRINNPAPCARCVYRGLRGCARGDPHFLPHKINCALCRTKNENNSQKLFKNA